MNELQILVYTLLGMLLGGVIGYERERAGKPAGLRTHMLVAAVAALLIGIGGLLLTQDFPDPAMIRSDPIRLIEAVVTGISFLGAGTIIRNKMHVEGLTTAASLLYVAVIGIAAGLQLLITAVGATLLGVFMLAAMRRLERPHDPRD